MLDKILKGALAVGMAAVGFMVGTFSVAPEMVVVPGPETVVEVPEQYTQATRIAVYSDASIAEWDGVVSDNLLYVVHILYSPDDGKGYSEVVVFLEFREGYGRLAVPVPSGPYKVSVEKFNVKAPVEPKSEGF